MDTHEVLHNLGLEEKEVAIYLALLELGEAPVVRISRKSGVKRPTAYVILESLELKGFITKIVRGKKTLFVPQPPKKLIIEAEFRLKELNEVMPQLESLLQKGSGKPRVMIYEGKEALDRAYDEVFIVKGEMLYIGNVKLFEEAFPRTMKKLQYARPSPEFRIRGLLIESSEARTYAQTHDSEHEHTRFIQKEHAPFHADIGIFGNRTLISSVLKDYFTVSIESEEIAHAFRVIFEMMWLSAKE